MRQWINCRSSRQKEAHSTLYGRFQDPDSRLWLDIEPTPQIHPQSGVCPQPLTHRTPKPRGSSRRPRKRAGVLDCGGWWGTGLTPLSTGSECGGWSCHCSTQQKTLLASGFPPFRREGHSRLRGEPARAQVADANQPGCWLAYGRQPGQRGQSVRPTRRLRPHSPRHDRTNARSADSFVRALCRRPLPARGHGCQCVSSEGRLGDGLVVSGRIKKRREGRFRV